MASLAAVARYLLWPPDLDRRPMPVRAAYVLGCFIFALVRDLLTGQLTLRAMSLVYIHRDSLPACGWPKSQRQNLSERRPF